MNIVDYIDPRSNLNTWDNFKKLTPLHLGITVLVSAIALALLVYGGFVAFRALTNEFRKIELDGNDPLSQQARRVDEEAGPLLGNPKPVVPIDRPPPQTMSKWKQFMRDELQGQLREMGLQFKEAEERGDCFYDAVAYLLTGLKEEEYDKQRVRTEVKEHLDSYHGDRYRDMLVGNIDVDSYETFRERIGLCVEDITDGAPIWGDKVSCQLIADIYQIEVKVHSVTMVEIAIADTFEGRGWEGHQIHRSPIKNDDGEVIDMRVEACTKIDTSTFKPENGPPKATLHLTDMTRGVWGHFMPVILKNAVENDL